MDSLLHLSGRIRLEKSKLIEYEMMGKIVDGEIPSPSLSMSIIWGKVYWVYPPHLYNSIRWWEVRWMESFPSHIYSSIRWWE